MNVIGTSGAGQPASITEADGRVHTFIQDVFGRCLNQETSRDGALESVTLFMWDGERLIREQTTRYSAGVGVSEEERNYTYEPATIALLAERRRWWALAPGAASLVSQSAMGSPAGGSGRSVIRTLRRDTGWLFHESAHDGSAGVLFFPDGRVAEHADIDPWGRLGQNTHAQRTSFRARM